MLGHESVDVAGLADDHRSTDRPDPGDRRQRRSRRSQRNGDALLRRVDQAVVAVDISSEFACDLLSLPTHCIGWLEIVDDRVDPGHGRDSERSAARNHLEEQGMQSATHLVLQPAEIAVSLRQQLQHT